MKKFSNGRNKGVESIHHPAFSIGKMLILVGLVSGYVQTSIALKAAVPFGSKDSESKVELILLVYTYPDLPTSQIRQIRARVAFILDNAAIRTKWLDCLPRSEEQQVPVACGQPLGPSELVVRLVDHAAASKADASMTTLGHSIAGEGGGSYATVYCAPVQKFARGDKTSEIAFLGHAIAHEIGHLLLGSNAHSSSGIMMANWGKREMLQIAMGQQGLLFSKEQAKSLRIALTARKKKEEGNQGALLNR